MNIDLIKKHIFFLNDKNNDNLVGFWHQGSQALNCADKFSDYDFIVVWRRIPEKKIILESRKKLEVKHKKFEIRYLNNEPEKVLESFIYKNKDYGFGHILDKNFFAVHRDIISGNYDYRGFMRLGGFAQGLILHDPDNKLLDYKNKIKVNSSIKKNYIEKHKYLFQDTLKKLIVAYKRKQKTEYLNELFEKLWVVLHIIYYLKNNHFPSSTKWILKDEEKFKTKSYYIKLIKLLNQDKSSFKEIHNMTMKAIKEAQEYN